MARKEKKRLCRGIFMATGFRISIALSFVVLIIYIFSRPDITYIGSIRLDYLKNATEILEVIEAKTLDMRFRLRGKRQPGDDIVIIAVDEKTEDDLGRWQSSGRRWIAQMLHILHEGGAKVIGFDLTLAEPDEGAFPEAVDAIKKRYLENTQSEIANHAEMLTYLDEVKAAHDYDRQLAKAIERAGNVVLGIYHFSDRASAAHLSPEKHDAYSRLINRVKYTTIKFPPETTRQPLRLRRSFGVEPNLPTFSEAAKSFGHFTVVPDRDGYIRQAPLLIEYMGDYYPSLNLEVARAYLNPPLPPIIHALGKEGGGSVDVIQMGNLYIPTDGQGNLLINFYGPGRTFPHYSISDVILGKIPPDTFKDKIVLFGFTSIIYQDVHSTPFQPGTYPGVEAHATVIENIIREDFLTRPEWTTLIDALILFLLGVVLGVALYRMHSLSGALTALICLAVVTGIAHIVFLFSRIWLNVTFPFIFIVLDYLIITSYKYFAEEKQKREIKHAFQHYVSPAVVDQMLETVDSLKLGGERKQLTALFSDIRGFTSISEKTEPEKLVQFLNEYLTAMTKIVLNYEGTIDKYMGDAIMAFYGAPLEPQEDHAVRACKTAVDMITCLKELRVGWKARELASMNIGIGINSGEMIVGNMGSEKRFDYTIIGDHVNLASRLEGINKEYGTHIVISQFTYNLIQHDSFTVRELDSVRVKGKEELITIYELIGYGTRYEQMQPLVKTFSEGLAAYKRRQWDQAIESFREALRIHPDDKPSEKYIARCIRYKENPPPEDWNGVFVMKTK